MPAPYVVGDRVESTDPEDAGELPGEIARVLLHGCYEVAWLSGRRSSVRADQIRPVTPVMTLRRVGGQMQLAPVATEAP